MSALKTLVAAAALMAVTAPAMAQGGAEPWDLRERNAYVLDMQGKMWSTRTISAKGWAMMTRSARAVPKGTVFFMNNGQLYMARARHVRPRRQLHGRRRLTDCRGLAHFLSEGRPSGRPASVGASRDRRRLTGRR